MYKNLLGVVRLYNKNFIDSHTEMLTNKTTKKNETKKKLEHLRNLY